MWCFKSEPATQSAALTYKAAAREKNEGRVSRKDVPDPGPRLTSTWSRSLVARVGVGRGGGSRCGSGVCTEASQPRKEWRDLKGHFVTRRGDGDRSRLHHFRLVVPGIDLHAAAQRQGRNLIDFGIV